MTDYRAPMTLTKRQERMIYARLEEPSYTYSPASFALAIVFAITGGLLIAASVVVVGLAILGGGGR
jgi:hypothetical protein